MADDSTETPAHWREKAAAFRAQAEMLLKRADEFDAMAQRMEGEKRDFLADENAERGLRLVGTPKLAST